MIIPDYLSQNAEKINERENCIDFCLKCQCGNKLFRLAKNTVDKEKNDFDKYWNSIKVPILSIGSKLDKNKKKYYYGITFLGIHVGKYYDDELPIIDNTIIIKAKCSHCGKIFIVFDNRKYGYDAVVEKNKIPSNALIDDKFDFLWSKLSSDVLIKVENSLNVSDFLNEFGPLYTDVDYSNAFTNIIIYNVINGKKRKFFENETA